MPGAEGVPRSGTLHLNPDTLSKASRFAPTEELSWQESSSPVTQKVMGKLGCGEHAREHIALGRRVSRLLGLWTTGRTRVERKGILPLRGLNEDTAKKEGLVRRGSGSLCLLYSRKF